MKTLDEFYNALVAALSKAEHYDQVILSLRATPDTSELMYDILRALAAYEASLDPEHDWRRGHELE